jgi:hypothetical protein
MKDVLTITILFVILWIIIQTAMSYAMIQSFLPYIIIIILYIVCLFPLNQQITDALHSSKNEYNKDKEDVKNAYHINTLKTKEYLAITIVFIVLWVIGFGIMYKFGMDWISILFMTLLVAGIYAICLFSPFRSEINQEVETSKKNYNKYKNSVETFYSDQFKATWTNAMNDSNKYYFIILISLIYLPVPVYIIYLWRHALIPESITEITLALTLLSASVLFTTLFYIFAFGLNVWYILIPGLISLLFVLYFKYSTFVIGQPHLGRTGPRP